jgi:hypothetical protein
VVGGGYFQIEGLLTPGTGDEIVIDRNCMRLDELEKENAIILRCPADRL